MKTGDSSTDFHHPCEAAAAIPSNPQVAYCSFLQSSKTSDGHGW